MASHNWSDPDQLWRDRLFQGVRKNCYLLLRGSDYSKGGDYSRRVQGNTVLNIRDVSISISYYKISIYL